MPVSKNTPPRGSVRARSMGLCRFSKISRIESWLRLGLGSGPHVVGRLGSEVWVSANFQIFALTAGGMP